MIIDLEGLFKKEAFASLGPERIGLFRQFARDIDGKKAPEIAGLYLKLNQQLSKDKPLTPAERGAIVEAIANSLPDGDRPKFNQILKMLNIR